MKKSKNKYRHKWVDIGGKETPIYVYTCAKCLSEKIKCDSFSAAYYDKNGIYIGDSAPECVGKTVINEK